MQTLEEVGVYNLKINQFNLEEFGLKLKYGVFETIDETTDVEELFSNLTSPATVVTENDEETDKLNLNYYPIPGATAYVFGIDFVLTPVVELNCEWAGQTGVSIKFPNYVDIRLATFNFDDGLPLPRESRIQFFQANKKVSGAVVFENWSIGFTQGLSGSAELVTGVKLGLAVSAGKADVAGTAIGAYVTFGKSFKLSGEGVMSLAGLSLSNPDVDLSFAGQLCFSTAFGFLNGSVFVDDNPLNVLDYELNIPLPYNVDILSAVDGYDPLSGLCVSLDQCSDILLDTLITSDIGNQEVLVKFNASNDDLDNKYNLRLFTDNESYLLTAVGNAGYTFNVSNLDKLLNVTPSFLAALKTKTYQVEVISPGLNCSKSFESPGGVFYSDCASPFLDFKSNDNGAEQIGVHATNIFGEIISYAKYVDVYGFGLEGSLRTLDQTKALIDGTAFNNCHNPSGFYHDKEMSKQQGSIQNSYVWIATSSEDEHNLLEIIPVFSGGQLSFEYKTHPYSANTYATLLK
jgi:hypothetical protein